jgi:hypothetical protein
MAMDKDNKDALQPPARRPYVAPRVAESAPFEHLILACARASSADDCQPNGPDDPSTLFS